MTSTSPATSVCELDGVIASAGFSSNHRFVVGHWDQSPLGPMDDVMWARPDGERVLIVDRPATGAFITSVYRFDRVEVLPLSVRTDVDTLLVTAGELRLALRAGRTWRIPFRRLRSRTSLRPIERLVARILLDVRTLGTSPTGVREWYRASEYRPVVAAEAALAGHDLGPLTRFPQPARFGFSEPPRRPAIVRARPRLEDPSGRLGDVLREVRSPGDTTE
ncbi:MAG: hypothetical protein M3P53_09090 [Actinomycetota bacterium]|nr:hypothetical protein [Actinomycetota bacterium]